MEFEELFVNVRIANHEQTRISQYARIQSSDETDAHLNANAMTDPLGRNPKRFTLRQYAARTVAHTTCSDTHENA